MADAEIREKRRARASLYAHCQGAKSIVDEPLLKDAITDEVGRRIIETADAIEKWINDNPSASIELLENKQRELEDLFIPIFNEVLKNLGVNSGALVRVGLNDDAGNNVLVIGNGGREHALLWKLSQSASVASLFMFPGNGAIESATSTVCAAITNVDDHQSIIDFCRMENITMVIVGPEQPLANGIVDSLTAAGIPCFGPNRMAAQLESSKKFAKEFMIRNGIPTAGFQSFSNPKEAKEFLKSGNTKYLVVKASGLALGKGVIVASNVKEAIEAVDFVAQFGNDIVLEEKLEGEELSALCFTDGRTVKSMPFAKDYKRLLDDDQGPITDGMGAFAPYKLGSQRIQKFIENEILRKTVTCLKNEGIEYKGVLQADMILTKDGPKVLEFNCRFGDLDAEVLMPLLRSDLCAVIEACHAGRLEETIVTWAENEFACGIVLASRGYPKSPETGFLIEGTCSIFSIVTVVALN